MKKPKPVVVTTICSLCGLDWERHGAEPTTPSRMNGLSVGSMTRPVTGVGAKATSCLVSV